MLVIYIDKHDKAVKRKPSNTITDADLAYFQVAAW